MTTAKIYKSYGVLAHEKKPFYSECAPASDIFEQITVEIPFPTWRNYQEKLGVTIDGTDYLLSDILTNWGDDPALGWADENRVKHHKKLRIID